MRKIWSAVLLIIIISISFMGCKNMSDDISDTDKDEADTGYQVFEADVIEAGERLLVSPDEDSAEFSSADRISVGLPGAKKEPDLIKLGDRIKIYYDGLIAESYPAQISAGKIELTGHNQIVDGFFSMIDDIYREDPALNSDIIMIAFDTGELDMLSETEIETILAMVKNEYGLEVIRGTYDELADQGLIDKEKLYFEKGVLFNFRNVDINKDRTKIACSIKKWRSGLGAIGWDAEAKYDSGQWNISRDNCWIS